MTDFPALFKAHNVKFDVKVNRGWTNVKCPFCDDRHMNGGFNDTTGHYTCWRCGWHRTEEALSLVLRVTPEMARFLVKDHGGTLRRTQTSAKRRENANEVRLPTSGFTVREREYLEKRGFNPDFLHKKYGVVGGGIAGKWNNRIIIPITEEGRIVSFAARTIVSPQRQRELNIPRYMNLPISQSVKDPKETFFNIDNARGSSVVLVEGAFDVMRMGDGFICSLGTVITSKQLLLLANRFKTVKILFDSEDDAQRKAARYARQLCAMGVGVEVADAYSKYGKNDAGDLTQDEADDLRGRLGM